MVYKVLKIAFKIAFHNSKKWKEKRRKIDRLKNSRTYIKNEKFYNKEGIVQGKSGTPVRSPVIINSQKTFTT